MIQLENDPSRNLVTKVIFCGVFQDSVVYEEDDRVELYLLNNAEAQLAEH